MHCPVYNATVRSAVCLEYQARARGESLPKKSIYSQISDGAVLWQIKYKPCLTCETGRQVKENGGDDSDVEQKIAQANGTAARQLKRCSTCKLEKPLEAFGKNRTNKDGLQISCRECQAAIQKKSYQKLKGMKLNQAENVTDHIADTSKMVVPADATVGRKNEVHPAKMPPGEIKRLENGGVCKICKVVQPIENFKRKIYSDKPNNVCNACWDIQIGRTCRNCGHQGPETDFYKTGSQGYTNVCKLCAAKKRAETIRQQAAAGLLPQSKLPAHCVVLNFSEHPELLENIRESAKINFRTVDNEIMFRVVSYEKPA